MNNNPLWTYSLDVYPRPGVEPLLLQLQDNFDADVNMLLCCCWLASQRQQIDARAVTELIAVSAQWRAQCVQPLRAVRRFLAKSVALDTGSAGIEQLYAGAKTMELNAERWQQDQLYLVTKRVATPAAEIIATNELARQLLQLYCSQLPSGVLSELSDSLSALVAVLLPLSTPSELKVAD